MSSDFPSGETEWLTDSVYYVTYICLLTFDGVKDVIMDN
jgi:hypothetical protein